MRINKMYFGLVILAFILTSCGNVEKKSEIIEQSKLKHSSNRIAAEWEPALGTTVVWPLDLPHQLIIELAKDAKLFTIVPNEEEIENAKTWFTKWNIDLNNVEFIITEQGLDSWWARDWGAFAVFDSVGTLRMADGQYQYSTPVTGMACDDPLRFLFTEKDEKTGEEKIILMTEDDLTPKDIAQHLGYESIDLPFSYTGGNVFMDGRGSALSTCIIKNENQYIGVNDEQLIADAKNMLGIDTYNFISNFEYSGIQHIDCLLKMLDNNRLFVMQPPVDHELYQIYEDVVNHELANLRNSKGEAYEIIRLNTARYSGEKLAAYSNSLILNKNVYVPLFGIAQDSIALQQWASVMPGYTVKGFLYNVHEEPALHPRVRERRADGFGWRNGDALHCRTRAIWDPEMLYISMTEAATKEDKGYHIEANIIDYSNAGLVRSELQVNWRVEGETVWNNTEMQESPKANYYETTLNNIEAGKTIEYFISAKTAAGKAQSNPMTAPKGFYSFTSN